MLNQLRRHIAKVIGRRVDIAPSEDAMNHYRSGVAASNAGRHEDALKEFTNAILVARVDSHMNTTAAGPWRNLAGTRRRSSTTTRRFAQIQATPTRTSTGVMRITRSDTWKRPSRTTRRPSGCAQTLRSHTPIGPWSTSN